MATILSAQCTDQRVNQVTPALFREVPDIPAMAAIPIERLQRMIVTTGFFRAKAKSLKGAARTILDRFGGEIPRRMEDLVTIPGVGRKTANVILGHVFGRPGMVVDTHVRRLSRRMGLTRNTDPGKIEIDLQKLIAPEDWTPFSMRLILHGRDGLRRAPPALRGLRGSRRLPPNRGRARQDLDRPAQPFSRR